MSFGKIATVAFVLTGLAACADNTEQGAAMREARVNASKADIFIPKNGMELENYNRRQKIADDPTTILWCTFFPFGDIGPVTFPIVGKLTSGNKRPYPTLQQGYRYPELPGPDGMYGSSGEYRYGFSPDGNYHDLYGTQTYCTTMPMIYRRQPSGMTVSVVEPRLAEATQRARAALRAGLKDGTISQEALANADRILADAMSK